LKVLCLTKEFEQSIAASDYSESFVKWLGKRNNETMPTIFVELFESKTSSQLNTIWRDFGEVAKTLFTDSQTVYALCMRSEKLRHFFIKDSEWGKDKRHSVVRLHSLSEFSKKECIEFIPEMRDFLQGLINNEYGEYVVVNWSKLENKGKPFIDGSQVTK